MVKVGTDRTGVARVAQHPLMVATIVTCAVGCSPERDHREEEDTTRRSGICVALRQEEAVEVEKRQAG